MPMRAFFKRSICSFFFFFFFFFLLERLIEDRDRSWKIED